MNASFMVLGLAMITGSVLLLHQVGQRRSVRAGLIMIAVSGIAAVIVGFFPENSVPAFHGIGAAIPFTVGNVGIALAGGFLDASGLFRIYSTLSGVIALVALGFYAASNDLALGEDGIERLVAYPQTVWLMAAGLYLLLHRGQDTRRASGL